MRHPTGSAYIDSVAPDTLAPPTCKTFGTTSRALKITRKRGHNNNAALL
jgi:hypothetical protein